MGQVGVIFDCDGTLLDSMGFWHGLDDRLAARVGATLTQADRDYMTACTIAECSAFLHERFGVGDSAADVEQMIDDEMLSYYRFEAVSKPGAIELVRALHEAEVPMGVASSTPPMLLKVGLEATGFAQYMRAICSVDDFGTSKREPLVYDEVRQALGTDLADTWVIEDAEYALKTAREAGYRTMSVYDSDIAGTPSALKDISDKYVGTLEDVDVRELLEI